MGLLFVGCNMVSTSLYDSRYHFDFPYKEYIVEDFPFKSTVCKEKMSSFPDQLNHKMVVMNGILFKPIDDEHFFVFLGRVVATVIQTIMLVKADYWLEKERR